MLSGCLTVQSDKTGICSTKSFAIGRAPGDRTVEEAKLALHNIVDQLVEGLSAAAVEQHNQQNA